MEPILKANSIVAGYQKRPVLHGVSLYAARGERVLVIGPNGCGKTTLLRVLAGIIRPESGVVLLKGRDVTRRITHLRARMGMGYLMQTQNVFPSLTVEDNLGLASWDGASDCVERREGILSFFPVIRAKLFCRAGLLSGGERQALAIAMVLMRPVDILLLDEPTAGLSPKAAAQLLECLHRAQTGAGFASIIVDHNLRLVQGWVSRILVMNQGVIVAERLDPRAVTPEELQRFYFE